MRRSDRWRRVRWYEGVPFRLRRPQRGGIVCVPTVQRCSQRFPSSLLPGLPEANRLLSTVGCASVAVRLRDGVPGLFVLFAQIYRYSRIFVTF